MSPSPQHFTAARLAEVLGISPQAIRKALRAVPASCQVRVGGGQLADAWAFAALPFALQQKLHTQAGSLGFRGGETMLTANVARWQPPIPRGEIAAEKWTDAQKLQRALAPALRRLHGTMSGADFDRAAVEDYRREFGHEVTPRHVRELLAMVRQRDGGAEDWTRLEIFLPENLKTQEARPCPNSAQANLSTLAAYVAQCSNPARLTELERRGLWAHACEEHAQLVAEGWTDDAAGRAVRAALASLPPLANMTRPALRMQLARKLALWRGSDETAAVLRDKREDNGSPVILPQSDFDLVIACAARQFRALLPPAVRYLIASKKLSTPALKRYGHLVHTRGVAPQVFVEACAYKAWLYYMYRMDRLDEETGSIERDWSLAPSLRVYSADDLTPCVYFYIPDGGDWFHLVRGQLLVFEDYSTGMILGYSLQPEAQYNSLVIRSLCTHVFCRYGVPTGLYFENGMWRKSVLLKGRKADTFSHAEVSRGLEDLGIRFTHTKHPWSKPIEKSFDLLQTLMQSEPGYCGRDERYDLPPEMKRIKQQVAGRKATPESLGLHSFDSWKLRIAELCQQFNSTPQHGARCGGLSPEQACEARMVKGDPNMTPTPQVRHLLALHRERRLVKAEGIKFQFRRSTFRYSGREIGHLTGQTVMAGFDPENPDMLTVEDPKTGLLICVKLAQKVNPAETILGDESGGLARELASVEGQVSELRAYFKALDCSFTLPTRAIMADALTLENGRRIEQGREKMREEKQLADRARRLAEKTGLRIDPANLAGLAADAGADFANYLKGDQ